MADAYARVSGRLGVAERPPGPRPDQRDDRHHRGGEEPDAAGGPRRRHRRGRGPVQLPHRPGRAGHRASARSPSGCTRPGPRSRTPSGRSGRSIVERRTVVLNLPLDVQADAVPDSVVDELAALRPVGPAPRRGPRRSRGVGSCSVLADAAPAGVPGRARGAVRRAGGRGPGRAAAARCSRPRPSRRDCSRATRGRWTSRGGFASPLAAELIDGADVVVAWGCALSMWTTRHGRLIGPGTDGRAGRLDAGRHRRALGRSTSACSATSARPRPRWPIASWPTGTAPPATGPRRWPGRIRRDVRWRDVSVHRTGRSDADATVDPRTLTIAAGRPAAGAAPGRRRLRQLHGLPEHVPVRTGPRRGSASPRRSSRSDWGWPPRSAPRWPAPDRLTVAALGDGGFLMGDRRAGDRGPARPPAASSSCTTTAATAPRSTTSVRTASTCRP